MTQNDERNGNFVLVAADVGRRNGFALERRVGKIRMVKVQTRTVSGLSVGLAYWLFAIVAYGVLLASLGGYESLSFSYHILLLAFPVGLVLLGRERLTGFGVKTGNLKQGIQYVGLLFIVLVAGTFFRSFIFHRPVYLVSDVISYAFFSTVIFAPITEELMHRGYLQPRLEKKIGYFKGLVVTSALFASIHIPKLLFAQKFVSFSYTPAILSNPVVTLFSFFALGLLFGFIYRETESVYYSTAAHMVVNFVFYFLRY